MQADFLVLTFDGSRRNLMRALTSSILYCVTGDPDLAVLVSYEIQAGSYITAIEGPRNTPSFQASMRQFAELFERLAPRTILEAGVGESTTLANCLRLIPKISEKFDWIGGFDVSLSRLLFGRTYCTEKLSGRQCTLFTGRLEEIPLEDDSVDLVFTSHAIEPNLGKEAQIITELFRVTKHWLVLREPSFDLGGEQTRTHIRKHRYADNIVGTVRALGLNIVEHRLWGHDFNPCNRTAVTVICKHGGRSVSGELSLPNFVNPFTRTRLEERDQFLYDSVGGAAFPIMGGIPCLLREQAILCARLPGDWERT